MELCLSYDLIFEHAFSTGISGLVKGTPPAIEETIRAYSSDGDRKEELLAESALTMWRIDAQRQNSKDHPSPYCGFNLAFPWNGKENMPKNVVLKIGDKVVGRFSDLKEPTNDQGVLASSVLSLSNRSFYGIQGMTLDNGVLRVIGVLTPPKGDVKGIRFVAPQGVRANLVWPIHDEGSGDFYWYVPGSPYLGFRIDIHLADSALPESDFLEFGLHLVNESDSYNELRNISVPLSLAAMMNFPPQYNIARVQRIQNRSGAAISGASDARRILRIAERHKSLEAPFRILDWGCGFGRVSRHLSSFARNATVLGADIDDENLDWMKAHLPHITPVPSDISGHIAQDDKSVDIVFGISVMTHLRVDVMKLWLKELCRITRNDGLLLLTVAADSSLAFTSRWVSNDNIDTWRKNGEIVFGNQGAVDSNIGGEDYYVQSLINEERVRAVWSEFVDVLEVIPAVFGYQDMVVCRPKG